MLCETPQGELDGNVTMAGELYLSVKQSSGLTQGLTMMGILAVIVATLGVCGSVRGSPKCLYCYAVSSMGMLVVVRFCMCPCPLASLSICVLIQQNSAAIHHHRHAQLQRQQP